MRKVKMIWDFRGPTAEMTAKHHLTHLLEYLHSKKIAYLLSDIETINEFAASAFIVVEETHVAQLRKDLNPNRGQLYTQ